MKDGEVLIIKAFLAALYQQSSLLPEKIQIQLQKIAQSLETQVMNLDEIALNTPTLKVPYENAFLWLTSSAAERLKGLDYLPADDTEDESSAELTNITPKINSSKESIEEVIAKIDAKYSQTSSKNILNSSNPVIAVQNLYR